MKKKRELSWGCSQQLMLLFLTLLTTAFSSVFSPNISSSLINTLQGKSVIGKNILIEIENKSIIGKNCYFNLNFISVESDNTPTSNEILEITTKPHSSEVVFSRIILIIDREIHLSSFL